MIGKDLINFITRNKLEDVKVVTEFTEGLCWSVYLNEDKDYEIRYSLNYREPNTVEFMYWPEFDEEMDHIPWKKISEEKALEMRGLA